MASLVTPIELDALRSLSAHEFPGFVRDLKGLVNIDSGSFTKPGVDRVLTWAADRLEQLGGALERHAHDLRGDTVVASFGGVASGPTVLMLAHADTVFDAGTARSRPFRIDGARAYGPGVYDMKGGLLLGLGALAVLRTLAVPDQHWLPVGRIIFVVNADEEIGSTASTPIIRGLAAEADAALVLEGARANGDVVTARAGMMHLRIAMHGRAAHAGVEPERGRSATLEAAHKTVALHALDDRPSGVTVNVGELHGGTRPNIVAEEAAITVDLRARQRVAQEEAAAAIEAIALASTVPEVTSTIEILAHHWPMEPSTASGRLVARAAALAAELGFELGSTDAGGASDANTTAASGVPSLDGLGPVGGHAHTPDEYVELDSVVPRMALLAGLLVALGRDQTWLDEG